MSVLSPSGPIMSGMARPSSPMRWTPGPNGVEPMTVAELARLLITYHGRPGISVEAGRPSETGMPVVNVVARDLQGRPIAILQMRMYGAVPGIVDIAVAPMHRRQGLAFKLAEAAYHHGIDLRDAGAIWDGPLTEDGRRFRDEAVKRGQELYGPASWEKEAASGCG